MIIYKCTFPNGKMYIGQTSRSLEIRMNDHRKSSKYKTYGAYNNPFHCAIRKYGWSNLTWEVIDYAQTTDELNEKEMYWISFYNTCVNSEDSSGYNVTIGGNSNKGYKPSESAKEKIRKANLREKNPNSKLTENDVIEILRLIKIGYKQCIIAKKYNVSDTLISNIKNGNRWNSLSKAL